MDSTPSKIITVLVRNCDDEQHAQKIMDLLRATFHHKQKHIETDGLRLSIKVKADSKDSIRKVISPVLGKAIVRFMEHLSPPAHGRFDPPTRSQTDQPES
jgi:hypothetical protein